MKNFILLSAAISLTLLSASAKDINVPQYPSAYINSLRSCTPYNTSMPTLFSDGSTRTYLSIKGKINGKCIIDNTTKEIPSGRPVGKQLCSYTDTQRKFIIDSIIKYNFEAANGNFKLDSTNPSPADKINSDPSVCKYYDYSNNRWNKI